MNKASYIRALFFLLVFCRITADQECKATLHNLLFIMKMQTLQLNEIIARIESGMTFDAICTDGSFRIIARAYVPYVATAIHAGHHLRESLAQKCLLNPLERKFEEDPYTEDMILGLPIVLYGLDSRYEYDLNRNPDHAVYDKAWGKDVWKPALTEEERDESLRKHMNYYKVFTTMVQKLESLYGICIVFDMHSYNHERLGSDTPLFNIGTENVDTARFGDYIAQWQRELSLIDLGIVKTQCNIDDVFKGRGYQAVFIREHHPNTLIFPTEVKKVYQHPENSEPYPEIIEKLSRQLSTAILNTVSMIVKDHSKKMEERLHHMQLLEFKTV
jgi:hypothetical protein